MPLSTRTRRILGTGLGSTGIAKQVADVIDAGSGTLGVNAKQRIRIAVGSKHLADQIITKIQAGTALTGTQQTALRKAIGDGNAAKEIATILAS